jgi:2-polyprenyl-6-hydroxyphenyl methylase/3-demethylubiquinone-9 3-methyltransferase
VDTLHQHRVNVYFGAAAAYWRDIYSQEDVCGAIYQERRARALDLVKSLCLPARARILEIGCGAGLTSVALARLGYLVDAVDTVPAMLDSTREHAARAGVEELITPRLADVHRLPFGSDAFSAVLALGVIPWLPRTAPAVEEMARVLAPGGSLIVTADQRWGISRVLDPLTNPMAQPLKRIARRLLARTAKVQARMTTIDELENAIAASGLEKTSGVTLGFGPFTLFHRRLIPECKGVKLHRRLQALADRGLPILHSAGAQYLMTARKVSNHAH